MANLQANLRSQWPGRIRSPERFLQLVKPPFYQNSTDSAYTTCSLPSMMTVCATCAM